MWFLKKRRNKKYKEKFDKDYYLIENVPGFPVVMKRRKEHINWIWNNNKLVVEVDGKPYKPSELKNIADDSLRRYLKKRVDPIYRANEQITKAIAS